MENTVLFMNGLGFFSILYLQTYCGNTLQTESLSTNFSPMDMFSFKGDRERKMDNLKGKKMLDRAVFNRRIKLHMRIVSLLCTVTMIEIAMSWP